MQIVKMHKRWSGSFNSQKRQDTEEQGILGSTFEEKRNGVKYHQALEIPIGRTRKPTGRVDVDKTVKEHLFHRTFLMATRAAREEVGLPIDNNQTITLNELTQNGTKQRERHKQQSDGT